MIAMRPHTHPLRHPVTFVLIMCVTGFLATGCSTFSDKTPPTAESTASVENTASTEDTASAESTDSAKSADSEESAENAESAERAQRTDTQIFVGDTIEMNYDPNVIMKRAESFHEQGGYAEAIVEYRHFLEMHHSHVLAPYAQYRLALSHFKMVDTIDRDVTPVTLAREEFVKLMTEFPGSHYEAESMAAIRKCDRHLARYHLFVGKFYYHKEAYMAAAKRFRNIIDTYPDVEEAAESKLYLTRTYKAIGALEWSRDWAVALVRDHPRHALRNEGLQALAALHKEHPGLADTDPVTRNALLTSFVPVTAARFASRPSHATPLPAASPAAGFRAAAATTCRVGAWCKAMGPFPTTAPPPPSPAARPVICRPGAWCE